MEFIDEVLNDHEIPMIFPIFTFSFVFFIRFGVLNMPVYLNCKWSLFLFVVWVRECEYVFEIVKTGLFLLNSKGQSCILCFVR